MLKVCLNMIRIPIIAIVGYSGSGKTRSMTELISILTQRGWRVASAKHCHDEFRLDVEGKDSWKHKQAGAVTTIMANRHQIGVIITPTFPLSLEEICEQYIYDADILLAEGYSSEPCPKILVTSRERIEEERVRLDDCIIALVGERQFDIPIPQFSFREMEALATQLEQDYLLPQLAAKAGAAQLETELV